MCVPHAVECLCKYTAFKTKNLKLKIQDLNFSDIKKPERYTAPQHNIMLLLPETREGLQMAGGVIT